MSVTATDGVDLGLPTTTSTEVPRWGGRSFSVVNALATAIFLVMIVATAAMVAIREVASVSAPWLDDVVRFLLVWSVYLGAGVLALRNDHISIDLLYAKLSPRLRRLLRMLIGTVGIVVSAYLAYLGWVMTDRAIQINQISPTGYLPAWIGFAAVPVGFVISAIGYVFYVLHAAAGRQ